MPLPATLGEALQWARGRADLVDARILLREASGCSAATLVGFPERALSDAAAERFVAWIERRQRGEPVAHLLGYREFYGRPFRVTPDTLIPRPDTELLVERALAVLGEWGEGASAEPPEVLDLGTGTGAVAISIALEWPAARVMATDASASALTVAQSNAVALGAALQWASGDWFAAVAGKRFALVVSNPPYIAASDAHLGQGDLRFEPLSALASGQDGLDDIRRIVKAAPAHLLPGGALLLEHGYDQAGAVRDLLAAEGFSDARSWRDLAGIERVSGARLGRP